MTWKSHGSNTGRKILVGISLGLFILAVSRQACQAALIELSDQSPSQGQTVQIFVTFTPEEIAQLPDREKLQVRFREDSYRLFLDESSDQGADTQQSPAPNYCYRALMGVPADIKPGVYSIEYGDQKMALNVKPANFNIQKIQLPKSKNNFKASPGEKEAISRAKSTSSSQRLWRGAFARPCQGRTSAAFGLRRMVNGRLLKDYFHTGLDFAAPRGTPVKAPAAGVVVLSRTGYRLHGNTVCLDHGQGVVSIYIHLDKISVEHGQEVDAGDLIGAVGNTGRASGPHLHFGLYVNAVATNPVDWFSKTF